MKTSMLILIGYITCTLKGEMNKTGAEEKTDNVEPPNDKDQQGDLKQPKDAVQPEGEETTAAVEPPHNKDHLVNVEHSEDAKQPKDGNATEAVGTTVSAAAVDITYAIEQPDDTKQPEDAKITDAVDTTYGIDTNTTYTVEQPVDIEQQKDAKTENSVDKTNSVDTTDAVITTYAVDTKYAVEQPEDVGKTEPKKKSEIQAEDTGPSNIKVEDALKILEKSKKKYNLESIALIKKLEWLRSTFNITELTIDHKIDPNEDFDDLSNTNSSFNSSNILRKRVNDGFLHVKHAILKVSNFEKFLPGGTTKRGIAQIKEEAKMYKTNFIATHSDRDNLKQLYLQDSE